MTKRAQCRNVGTSDWRRVAAFAILAFGLLSATVAAEELQKDTIQAFERYMKITEENREARRRRSAAFLWIDHQREARRRSLYERLKRGDIVVERLETRDDNRSIPVPHGIIHHYVSVVFIPGTTVSQTIALMEDYPRYPELFKFGVERSKVLRHESKDYEVQLRLFRKGNSSVFYNIDLADQYVSRDAAGGYRRSRSIRIAELTEVGKPSEHELPVGKDRGFLWRMNTDWSCQEKDGGVYLQLELTALSRDIPAVFVWLANPYVRSIPQAYLEQVLQAMRSGLVAKPLHFGAETPERKEALDPENVREANVRADIRFTRIVHLTP
jgi:hypothetical protein